MRLNRDPMYLDVLSKRMDGEGFLKRHYLPILSGDGWVRALRKKCPTPRRAEDWGLRVRTKLVRRYDAQFRQAKEG